MDNYQHGQIEDIFTTLKEKKKGSIVYPSVFHLPTPKPQC